MIDKETNNETGTFTRRKDNIIIAVNAEVHVDEKVAMKAVETIHDLMQNEPHYLVVDIRPVLSANREARKTFASDENNKNTIAVAFVVNSIVSKTIANFFLNLNILSRPTKLFNSVDQAINWLHTL